MNKKPVGHVIKSLISEKNLSAEQVAKLVGKSKAQVYNDYNRVGMKDDEIERYANGLNVNKELIYKLMESGTAGNADSPTYLVDHLQALEEKFAAITEQLQNQLAVKDRQIEKLLDLLGKLSPASGESKEMQHPALLARVA